MRPKLAIVGYVILCFVVVLALVKIEALNNRHINDCVDKKGDVAFRNQDKAVIDIYQKLDKKEISADQARDMFINTYKIALVEAGPAPDCIKD